MRTRRSWWDRFTERLRQQHLEDWMLLAIAIAAEVVIGLRAGGILSLHGGDLEYNPHYLLSTIVQGLAAILAVLVTITLVSTQLAAQAFTPQIVAQRMKDGWLWLAVIIYGVTIVEALIVMAQLRKSQEVWNGWGVDLALVGAASALFYLAPYTLHTLRTLRPDSFARYLAQDPALYEHLEDMMRRAVNEGLRSTLESCLRALVMEGAKRLAAEGGAIEAARKLAHPLREAGRYACQRRNPEAWELVLRAATALTTFCTESRWRGAADVFNDVVTELYDYGVEQLGGRP